MLFAEGVPNAAAAHLSLMLSLKGPCQTVIGTRTAGLDALRLAATRIAAGEWDRAVVGAAEEYSKVVNAAYEYWGLYAGRGRAEPFAPAGSAGFVPGCGAVTLVLEGRASLEARGATRVRGRVLGGSAAMAGPRDGMRSVGRVLVDLGAPQFLLSSANGTWIDRVEAAGIERAAGEQVSNAI